MEEQNSCGPKYHERQSSALCLKHALNNLLQSDYFTKADLDGIAKALPHQGYRLFNPHKWLFFGNYDVNVMMLALEGLHKDVRWHDERDRLFENVELNKCWALILNSQGQGLAQKELLYCRYSLDSVQPFPQQITGTQKKELAETELKQYLHDLKSADSSIQLFIISEKKTAPSALDF